jgi:hypothetical protein
MTVIVLFTKLGIGISDVLITVDGKGKWSYLPSIGIPGKNIESLDFYSPRLVRKVARISVGGQRSSFMLAGTVNHVREFINIAQDLAQGRINSSNTELILDRKNIQSVLTHAIDIINEDKTKISLLGIRGAECIKVSNDTEIARNFKYFGDVFICGSGAKALEKYLGEREGFYEKNYSNDDEDMKKWRIMHFLPMQLLNADRSFNSPTITQGVGAFYEVLLNFNGSLDVDNMGWLRITADIIVPSYEIVIRGIWWHYYENEDLIIASAPNEYLNIRLNDPASLSMDKINVSRVPPYDKKKIQPPPLASSLLKKIVRSKFISFCLCHPEQEKNKVILSMASRGKGIIQVKPFKGELVFSLDPELYNSLVLSVKNKS